MKFLLKISGLIFFTLLAIGSASSDQNAGPNSQAAAGQPNCWFAMSQGYLAPTQSGGFGESQANANAAYSNCMNGR